jgi:hypothetical protein
MALRSKDLENLSGIINKVRVTSKQYLMVSDQERELLE